MAVLGWDNDVEVVVDLRDPAVPLEDEQEIARIAEFGVEHLDIEDEAAVDLKLVEGAIDANLGRDQRRPVGSLLLDDVRPESRVALAASGEFLKYLGGAKTQSEKL